MDLCKLCRSIGLRIENLENGGRAQQDGRLHLGDRITEVNGISLTGVDFIRSFVCLY